MALTYNTTINFNAAAGYTCEGGACPSANIEFTAGGARVKPASGAGVYVLVSPSLSTAGFGQIYSAVVTATEAAGYYHKFLISFDGGATFKAWSSGGWQAVSVTDLTAAPLEYGMSLAELNDVREWPLAADFSSLYLLVFIVKAAGGGNGLIDLWTVAHGTTIATVTGEPDGADVLANDATNPFYQPDFVMKREVDWDSTDFQTEMGYESAKNRASLSRSTYDSVWANRTATHATNIQTFLEAHQDVAFVWTPPGFASSKKWVALEPSITLEDPGVYTVRAVLVEVLPV